MPKERTAVQGLPRRPWRALLVLLLATGALAGCGVTDTGPVGAGAPARGVGAVPGPDRVRLYFLTPQGKARRFQESWVPNDRNPYARPRIAGPRVRVGSRFRDSSRSRVTESVPDLQVVCCEPGENLVPRWLWRITQTLSR